MLLSFFFPHAHANTYTNSHPRHLSFSLFSPHETESQKKHHRTRHFCIRIHHCNSGGISMNSYVHAMFHNYLHNLCLSFSLRQRERKRDRDKERENTRDRGTHTLAHTQTHTHTCILIYTRTLSWKTHTNTPEISGEFIIGNICVGYELIISDGACIMGEYGDTGAAWRYLHIIGCE